MKDNQITVKCSKLTRDSLRLIAALTGEKQHEVLARLVKIEIDKIQK